MKTNKTDSGGRRDNASTPRGSTRRQIPKWSRYSLMTAMLALLVLMPRQAAAAIGGAGTEANPFTINSTEDFTTFAKRIKSNEYNSGYYYKLTANISYSLVVGIGGVGNASGPFRGNFDGGGYTISIPPCWDLENNSYIGLFEVVQNAVIKNLNVSASLLHGKNHTGVLIGEAQNNLTLENVHVRHSGKTVKSNIASGGFIGTLYRSTGSPTVSITNCSYINIATLNFTHSGNFLDGGGFVGHIGENFGSITFTDCLVHLNEVILNSAPFGGFIGATHSNVTMTRCVQTGNPVTMNATQNRAYIAGWIKEGKTITARGVYAYNTPYRGTSGTNKGTFTGTYAVTNWSNASNIWSYLERKNSSAATIAKGTAGNKRWGYYDDTRPQLSSTAYTIQIIKGENISSVSGTNIYNSSSASNYYYINADKRMTVTSTFSPTSHQRVDYTFTKAYNGATTETKSGNNLLLTSAVDGTVSASLTNIPYPYWTSSATNGINAELLPFDSKIRVSWKYSNPQSQAGKFYVYYKQSDAASYTRSAAITLTNGSGSYDKSYDITLASADFNKNYHIIVAYSEGTPYDDPSSVRSADRASIINFSTAVALSNWKAAAAGGENKITVTISGIDNRFTGSAYSYKIQRSINGSSYEDWLTNQSFSGKISYTHDNTGITTSCDKYRYKVIISAFGTSYEQLTGEASSTGNTKFLSQEPFKATKGEQAGYVRLQWKVNRNSGGTNDIYKIFRRIADNTPDMSAKWDEMETVSSNAGTIYWNDNNALTGVFYKYKVVLYQNCSSKETELDNRIDIGFTQAFGIVSGRVTYGTGSAVQDVNMLVRRNDLQDGEQQYHSLKSIGGGQAFEWRAGSDYFNAIWTAKNWTLQCWLRPDGQNTGVATIGYIGDLPIYLAAEEDGYQLAWTSSDVSYRSEIIPANKFSHIAITRSGDNVRIYTVNDDKKDSIYIKNKAFTYTAAAKLTAANSKISFGHDLKGNIDEVRFWNKALTEAEIKRDYSRTLVGNESGLKGYWTFDENLEGYAFDRSRVGTVYNNNHATSNTLSYDTQVPDDTYQLALKATTDKNGNYQISGISYQGEGTSYSIVPSYPNHGFNPTEQLRYISPNSMVHNATDFTDISSFKLRGTVVYEGGDYPVTDCQFEIDGKIVMTSGGEIVKSDYDGKFELSVPIGQHSVRVVKTGHTFANGGYLKDAGGADFVWNAPKANVLFHDQTKVKLLGRVVGGNAENGKPLGFGESLNNIGVQTITLKSTREKYDFVSADADASHKLGSYKHNNAQWKKAGGLTDDETTVNYNAKELVVNISPVTGEFVAMVYPESYDIQPIEVTQGSGKPVLKIKDNAENIDLSATAVPDKSYLQTEIRTWKDSVYISGRPGVVDHWEYSEKSDTVRYNAKWTYKYQATPTFGMKQLVNGKEVAYLGEKTHIFKDDLAGVSETLDLYNAATGRYMFGKPVFQQGNKYKLRFNAYEEYTNYVSNPAVTESYPISKGKVNLTNNLQVTPSPESLTMDSVGILDYSFTAGAPNLTTAQSDMFATLTLGAVSYYWDRGTNALEAWQLGEKTTGTNFMTSGPDQLSAILRDPPGTNSHAYIEKGTTYTSTSTTSVGETVAAEMNLTTSLGPKITTFVGLGAGIITETEVKADIKLGLSSEQSYSYETEETTTTSFTERFETSSSPDYVGAMGDVFIGNSTNILYGLTNGVRIQKGETAGTPYASKDGYKIAPSAAIAYGQEFSTHFAFTTYELENIMIPKWQNSIKLRLKPKGYVVLPNEPAPVYVSKLDDTDANYGKWNLDKVFKDNSAFDLSKPYDGASYTIHFPSGWLQKGDEMKNFQDSILWANNQINTWKSVLAQNEKEKVEMKHKGNYSFGGGASIEYSEATTANTSYTHNFGFTITPSLGTVVGGEVMGIGLEFETSVSVAVETSGSTGGGTEKSKTTGFVLAEEGDDDQITVDYGYTASGTFAFKTRGGQTSCPYEGEILSKYYKPGQYVLQEATMQIEVPVINVSSASSVLNVPANRTATFTLALQNESEIGEDVWYQLIVDEATNPNGAELKIDGIGIGNGRTFLVKAKETLTKTLTVGKGRVDNYPNIGLILRSMCQNDPTGAWDVIADTTWVTAHFVPACSDVKIYAPANNFIVNTESKNGGKLTVTLQDFDVNFPNFGWVRLEQRRVGTPDYTTVRTFYPSNLFADPTNTEGTKEDIGDRAAIVYEWEMPDADGQYEIRATTASVNIEGNKIKEVLSTYSTAAITGYKDMTKPKAIGAPSPANGILGAGDELSVTFNEEVQTSMLKETNFNVTYGASKTAVPVNYVASSNKITLEYPSDYFSILEGETLNIEITDIQDMRGNKSDNIAWTALVNRNALVWDTDEIILSKEAGKTQTFTAKIKNAGTGTLSYSFSDANLNMSLPQWLSVNQPTGTLQPQASKELTFTVSAGVNLGSYNERIGITSGNLIGKYLPLNLTVTAVQPDWSVNPAHYESTMTVTGRVQIEGVYQNDKADILAAFIGDECVGKTSPMISTVNGSQHYTFLTVHGNSAHVGTPIKFKLWDASTGNVYSVIESTINGAVQNFTFAADATKGTASVPVIHNASNIVEQVIALDNGWNWISVNVQNSGSPILSQFINRVGAAGEILKSQNGYIEVENGSWVGNLASIDKERMYVAKTNAEAKLRFDGTPADAATSPIALNNGWNWIGYIPQFTLPVNEALSNLTPKKDDHVKSHTAYRTYAGDGNPWIGNLDYMRPGEGYMYKSETAGSQTFSYPGTSSQIYRAPMLTSAPAQTNAGNHYAVNIYKYPNNQTMTSVVLQYGKELHSDRLEIGAFDENDECRGSILLKNYPQIAAHPYLAFLMVYGEGDGTDGIITFKVYDHDTGLEYQASNEVLFETNAMYGKASMPYQFIIGTPTNTGNIGIEQTSIYPNPAVDVVYISVGGGNAGVSQLPLVKIYDLNGALLFSGKTDRVNMSGYAAGMYLFDVDGEKVKVIKR